MPRNHLFGLHDVDPAGYDEHYPQQSSSIVQLTFRHAIEPLAWQLSPPVPVTVSTCNQSSPHIQSKNQTKPDFKSQKEENEKRNSLREPKLPHKRPPFHPAIPIPISHLTENNPLGTRPDNPVRQGRSRERENQIPRFGTVVAQDCINGGVDFCIAGANLVEALLEEVVGWPGLVGDIGEDHAVVEGSVEGVVDGRVAGVCGRGCGQVMHS